MGSDLSIDRFRAMANKPAQTIESATHTRQISAAGAPRKPVTSAMPLVNPGIRESILAQVCIFGKTCGQVARQTGLERHTVETVLIQELSKQAANEYRRGYRDGRKPSPPAGALRPQLAGRLAA